MTDVPGGERPMPRYGEYATPEEQAARIRQPLPAPAAQVPQAAPAAPRRTDRAATTPGRILDRGAAVALLAYGLLSLANGIPAILDPAPLLAAVGLDAGELGVTTTGVWGVVAALLLGIGWLATAWLTWLAHRRGWAVVFWIPLVGGLAFNALSGVIVAVALLGDPVVMDAVLRQSGG